MGVDFYTCANCAYNFPDCGDFFGCDCGEHFCSAKCGGRQVEDPPDDLDEEKNWEDITTCILCRREAVTDVDMVHFLLEKLSLTYEQAVDMFRKEAEANDDDNNDEEKAR